MLTHELGAGCSVSSRDLSEMLFDQISAHSMVLVVPDRPCVVSLLVIMGSLELLLKPKLFKDLKDYQAGAETFPAVLLVLESKAHAHNDLLGSKGNIYARIVGSILHSTRFTDGRDKLKGIITLLIIDGINNLIAQLSWKCSGHVSYMSSGRGHVKKSQGQNHMAGHIFDRIFLVTCPSRVPGVRTQKN